MPRADEYSGGPAAVTESTSAFSQATGGNTDPFYFSTGTRKDVTVNGVVYKNAIDVGSTRPPAADGVGSISPATGLTITGDQRNAAKELEARLIGYTKEYIASRGGINDMGYFNDTPLTGQLNAAEYKSVTKSDGTIDTAKMWAILNQKQGGKLGPWTGGDTSGTDGGSGPKSGGYDANGNPVTGGQYDASGNFIGSGSLLANPEYAAIISALEGYGLNNLASVLERIRVENPNISGEGMLTLLRNDARYNKDYLIRFAGNEKLKAAGKPMLDEKTYLANEAAYDKIFTQYQLPQFVNRSKYADFIGSSIAPTEVASRVSLAYDRLIKSNPGSLDAFRRFFPQLSAGDIVGAMLDPKEQLPALQRKVAAAEIGGAAIEQGLNVSLAAQSVQNARYANLQSGTIGAEAIQQYGIDKETAQVGYEVIATELPTMEKLSSIYKSTLDQYTQKEAEQEQFIGLASAKRKKQQLIGVETAQFQSQSGASKGAFSTQYLNRQSSSGAY
jgi:hypothetical protein